jgi:hypothetical protein
MTQGHKNHYIFALTCGNLLSLQQSARRHPIGDVAMNPLPKTVQKRVMTGKAFDAARANREADRLDYEGRLAYLDGREAQAKKYSRYADQLRRMAREAA